jgi:cytoskeletal protein CcmA (bactofilin family)
VELERQAEEGRTEGKVEVGRKVEVEGRVKGKVEGSEDIEMNDYMQKKRTL